MSLRTIFMGSPEFAVPSLNALVAHSNIDVIRVVSQPARPAGRKRVLTPTAVTLAAQMHEIDVLTPENLSEIHPQLVELRPDLIVVVAYGQLLKRAVLDLPPSGCINVHASLLPRWRGAAPIQRALLAGDSESGVTIMKMEEGLDTGPMLSSVRTPISAEDTGQTLHDRLSLLGATALTQAIDLLVRDRWQFIPQPEEGVTYAAKLSKDEGRIDWRQAAQSIDRQVRAFTPWPGTFSSLNGVALKIKQVALSTLEKPVSAQDGEIIAIEADAILVACGEGVLAIKALQTQGRKQQSVSQWLNGNEVVCGARFTR